MRELLMFIATLRKVREDVSTVLKWMHGLNGDTAKNTLALAHLQDRVAVIENALAPKCPSCGHVMEEK